MPDIHKTHAAWLTNHGFDLPENPEKLLPHLLNALLEAQNVSRTQCIEGSDIAKGSVYAMLGGRKLPTIETFTKLIHYADNHLGGQGLGEHLRYAYASDQYHKAIGEQPDNPFRAAMKFYRYFYMLKQERQFEQYEQGQILPYMSRIEEEITRFDDALKASSAITDEQEHTLPEAERAVLRASFTEAQFNLRSEKDIPEGLPLTFYRIRTDRLIGLQEAYLSENGQNDRYIASLYNEYENGSRFPSKETLMEMVARLHEMSLPLSLQELTLLLIGLKEQDVTFTQPEIYKMMRATVSGQQAQSGLELLGFVDLIQNTLSASADERLATLSGLEEGRIARMNPVLQTGLLSA